MSHDEDMKGWGEWEQKGTQLWQARQANSTQKCSGNAKGPCDKARKYEPCALPAGTAFDSIGSSLT